MDLSKVTRPGVTVPLRVGARGGPTPKQARGPHWRRVGWGLHVPAEIDPDHPDQRIVEAAATAPGGGVVTGWAGLHWAGAEWFGGLEADGVTRRPVPLAIGHDRTVRAQPGTLLSEQWLTPDEVIEVDGLPLTTPARSACFEIRRARSLRHAVVVADMAARSDLVSLDEIAAERRERHAGRPNVTKIDRALELADENVWSPRESLMGFLWTHDGGFPRPLRNVPVFAPSGAHLFTPDLLDPVNGVVGEYDGLLHLEDARRSRDLGREDLIRDVGLELVVMMAEDNQHHDRFLRRLAAAYARARRRPSRGGWTLEQPPWWVDTSTVARRRQLSEEEHARWLHRHAG